jgi:hypothetical protein
MKCYVLHDSSDSPSLLVTIFCHDSLSMVKTGLAVLCDWSPWSFINAHALVVIHIHHRRRRGAKLSAIESFHFLINRKKYLAEHPITFTTKITTRGTRHRRHNNLRLCNNTNRTVACKANRHPTYIASGAHPPTHTHTHTHTHTRPQCLTQQCPRQASRPSSSAVPESRSTPSHLRPRICLKHSSQSRTDLWSGILWIGVIAWVSLVCLVPAHCIHNFLQVETNSE